MLNIQNLAEDLGVNKTAGVDDVESLVFFVVLVDVVEFGHDVAFAVIDAVECVAAACFAAFHVVAGCFWV